MSAQESAAAVVCTAADVGCTAAAVGCTTTAVGCTVVTGYIYYIYVAIHALASMPSAPRVSEADSKTSTEVPCLYEDAATYV
jgi:hypothetical protein